MGFDNDCIVNIQSLAGEYFCAVCRTLVYPNEAIQAPCTHLYCKPCLTYVVSTTHACPYDGYRVTEADSKPLLESNKTLADTIGKIQVHCLYYRTGCSWEGTLSECTSHCTTCTSGESAVLCNRCGIQLKHREVQEHAQNCSGVPSQVQQPGVVQDSTSSVATAAAAASAIPDQTQSAIQTGSSAPQAMPQASASLVSTQGANQTTNSTTQPQNAQSATLTPEQVYQQQLQYQQQYQQYYQQYPGYDPYQQNYQYYYQYPQVAQQYQQQQAQAYPQAYVQPQPQGYGQAQMQPIVQGQQQVQPQVPPQGAQPPLQPAQTAVNVQPLAPTTGQTQPQMPTHVHGQSQIKGQTQAQAQPQVQAQGQVNPQLQAPGQAPMPHAPYSQSQPLPQAPVQPAPQQQAQVPQYPHTHPHTQHSHAQAYPQSQTQHYPNPPPQVHPQPHSQPNLHAPIPPQQPYPPSAQPQNPNAVSGYQSYPQPQLHPQAQTQYSNKMQGPFPTQPAQMRPPQSYANVPNQQQPAMLSAQGQPPSGPPVQQQPLYPQAQQPGHSFQQRPSVQAAQHAVPQQYGQHQINHAQAPYMHNQASMNAQLHSQGAPQMPPHAGQNYGQPPSAQPNVAHNYAGRPMGVQAVAHPYTQAAGQAGVGQVRPHSNQNFPMKANKQPAHSQQVSSGETSRDPVLEKGLHSQINSSKEVRNMDVASSAGCREDEIKVKAKSGSAASAGGNDGKSNLSGSKQMPGAESKVDSHANEAKPNTKADSGEGVSKTPANADKSGVEVHGDALRKGEAQYLKNTAKHAADSSAPPSALRKTPVQSQVHGANSFPSTYHGINQRQPMPYGQHKPDGSSMPQSMTHPVNSRQPASLGHPSNQFRPQETGRAPSSAMAVENQSGGILGPGSLGTLGRPGNVSYYHGDLPPCEVSQSQNPVGDPLVGPPVTAHLPGASRHEIEKFEAQRAAHFDVRQPDSHSHGPIERTSFGHALNGIHPGDMKFGGPSPHDPMSDPGMRDERAMQHFPRREIEDDFRKFPIPPHLEAGPSSNYGRRFPSSGPLDQGSHIFSGDGMMRSFDKGPHGFDRDPTIKVDGVGAGPSRLVPPFHPKEVGERAHAFVGGDMGRANLSRPDFPGPPPGSGFGRQHMDGLPPRSLGSDYPGFPSRAFGPYGDVSGNESRPFEGSKPTHESRFPVPPRVDVDVHGNLRLGEHLAQNQDLMPDHLRRGGHMGLHNLHSAEATSFGRLGGPSRIEPPLSNFPSHLPFGGEKPGHPLQGDPGFWSDYGFPHNARDDGFYPREMDPFGNSRKQNLGSIMCRICQVECGTVEGLDLHSQSREHQRKARDMVLSIKQQNKKQKILKDQASVEEGRGRGRPKNSGFQGRGNKR